MESIIFELFPSIIFFSFLGNQTSRWGSSYMFSPQWYEVKHKKLSFRFIRLFLFEQFTRASKARKIKKNVGFNSLSAFFIKAEPKMIKFHPKIKVSKVIYLEIKKQMKEN